MDLPSLCSTDLSEGLTNDTFELTRRGRQDVLMESRLDFPFPYETRNKPSNNAFSFPMTPSSASSLSRRVDFSGKLVINDNEHEIISEEDMASRWWSQSDLEEVKKGAKEMSLQLRRMAKERGCYVETAHKKTTLMLKNDFKELVKLSSSSPDQDLRHWCARSDGRRGLERFASKEFCNSRKDDVIDTRNTVFQEQERQRQLNVYLPEEIAKISKEKSRRARTFSLFMGEADAQEAVRGTSSSKRTAGKRSKEMHATPKRSRSKLTHHHHVTPNAFQVGSAGTLLNVSA